MKEKKNLKEIINFKENKKLIIIVSAVAVVIVALIIAIICANDGSKDEINNVDSSVSQDAGVNSGESTEKGNAADNKTDVSKDDKESGKTSDTKDENTESAKEEASAPQDTKYTEEDVYEKEDGVLAAKTESGTEVELTGESLQKIFAEYEEVKGSGSEREKELLDQLQLIFDTQGAVQ